MNSTDHFKEAFSGGKIYQETVYRSKVELTSKGK